LSILFFGVCSVGLAQAPSGGTGTYSFEDEALSGRQIAEQIRRNYRPIYSVTVEHYLSRLGARIASQIPDARFPFTFGVIEDDPCEATHEAIAAPGGYVFVPSQLFVAAKGEAEFAGMLADAMEAVATGYRVVLARHRRQLGKLPRISISGRICEEQQTVPQSQEESRAQVYVKEVHDMALDVDTLAIEAMSRAGFDPEALVRYIERVEPTTHIASTTLPGRDERLAAMRSAIARLPQSTYVTHDDEFTAIQEELLNSRLTQPITTPPAHTPTRLVSS
jgi:predicted Zn-dependent protease